MSAEALVQIQASQTFTPGLSPALSPFLSVYLCHLLRKIKAKTPTTLSFNARVLLFLFASHRWLSDLNVT